MKKLFVLLYLLGSVNAWASPAPLPASTEARYLFELSSEDVEKAVSDTLVELGAADNIAATMTGHDRMKPVFSYNKPISVELRGFTFDKRTSRWSASLMAISEKNVVTALPISGRFEEVLEVPVLKRQIRAGETISQSDIEFRTFPIARTRAETITSAESLIGQSPRRTISAHRPIREHEVAGPVMIEKNSIIQVRYQMPGMEISTTAQAMESGSKGAVIPVRNVDSKTIIHATVTGRNIAIISQPKPLSPLQASTMTGASHATN